MIRELRKLKPTVVHFSASGQVIAGECVRNAVSTLALGEMSGAAGSSVRLVVLNACYSDQQAAALLPRVDCVVGIPSSLGDDATRTFTIAFYGGLGNGESIESAFVQGCAAIALQGMTEVDRPHLKVRSGADVAQLVLATGNPAAPALIR